jgi:uncharacterized protein
LTWLVGRRWSAAASAQQEPAETERLAQTLNEKDRKGVSMTELAPAIATFFEAVRAGDDSAVEAAVAADAELLHAHDSEGLSPVLAAAFAGHAKLASRLGASAAGTENGLDFFDAAAVGNVTAVRAAMTAERAAVDDRGPDGYTSLHLAAAFGHLEVARLLMGRGADPNAVTLNSDRLTPLHSAVAAKHRDTASLLLALGASPNNVQRGGFTALHIAARDGDEAIVDMLLLRGADATRRSDDGKTPIDLAVENGHGALAGLLRGTASKR